MKALFLLLLLLPACTIGEQVLIVGKACTSDADCDDQTECVPADSASADRVCMPFDDEGQ